MPTPAADRNLIFGLLALQMDFVTREQLLDAMAVWMLRKTTPLGAVLRERGTLNERRADLLAAMVEEHVAQHGGDPQASMGALRIAPQVLASLAALPDADIQASLAPANKVSADGSVFATVAPRPLADNAPAKWVRYSKLRAHAKGGLGEVFVARDEELHREVALKEIQDHLADHDDSRARFVREAEITGHLEHPGVVPVYGLGAYPDGRPFYAMRFIRGESLREAIQRFHQAEQPRRDPGERRLALRELLGRFVAVCNAVGYAHSRGVIHRDLKPANVMLGEYGETLVVDWGLARVMNQDDPESTTAADPLHLSAGSGTAPTELGLALGTPAYMSPEQARGKQHEVGPASDVFALGAILHNVLTGEAPYQGANAQQVLEQAKVGRVMPALQRRASVPRALQAVYSKAMACKAADRYATARALAEEVKHWLADEPVTAYREPMTYRVRRWARRHRTLVSTAAVLAVAAVGGLVAVLAVQRQANADLEAKNAALAQQQKEAEARFELAQKAIATLHTGVSEDLLLKSPELKEVRTKLLKEAASFYSNLEKRLAGRTDAKSRKLLADGYFQLGELTEKIGDQKEALAVQRKALALRRELAAPGVDVETRLDVARSLRAVGWLLISTGDMAEALLVFQEQRDLAAALEAESPTDAVRMQLAHGHNCIGAVLHRTGKPAEALREFQKVLAIRQKLVAANPDVQEFQSGLATSHSNIGIELHSTGKTAEALRSSNKTSGTRVELLTGSPSLEGDTCHGSCPYAGRLLQVGRSSPAS